MESNDLHRNNSCDCTIYKGIHTLYYGPGTCEAIVQCQSCGQLYYSLLYEQMSFHGEDVLEEYHIPITETEMEELQASMDSNPDLNFHRKRKARAIYNKTTTTELNAEIALKRCGRLS